MYVVVTDTMTVKELAAAEGNNAALFKAECPKLDTNPVNG
jgi:hypothetical protein